MAFTLLRASLLRRVTAAPSIRTFHSIHEPQAWPGEPVRQVFISQSTDVFTNLALEDWLFKNHDIEHKHLLLLWRGHPDVADGGSPCPLDNFAGRNSTYYDSDNLRCTFFVNKTKCRSRLNVDIICSAIRRAGLDVSVSKDDDIVLNNGNERLGTATKAGKENMADGDCTVLVDVNECVLHETLNPTPTVRVPVETLQGLNPALGISVLQEAIGWEFLRTNTAGIDEGMQGATRQRGFEMVRPDDGWFPGLEKLRENVCSHHWMTAKTPTYKVTRTFPLPSTISADPDSDSARVLIEFHVRCGIIRDVRMQLPLEHFDPNLDISKAVLGLRFGPAVPQAVSKALSLQPVKLEKRDFLYECMKVMTGM